MKVYSCRRRAFSTYIDSKFVFIYIECRSNNLRCEALIPPKTYKKLLASKLPAWLHAICKLPKCENYI